VWQVPHGEYKSLTRAAFPARAPYIRRGQHSNKGGVVFAAGTLDMCFRAYMPGPGRFLWESTWAAAHSQRQALTCGRKAICRSARQPMT